jgi:nicotinamidase/pyrazinamidase
MDDVEPSFEHAALLVVDMQNDFIDGSLTVPNGVSIIPQVNLWVEIFEDLERPILYSMDWHPAQTPHFDRWPVHCVAGTLGAQIHTDVIYEPGEMANVITILKGRGQDDGYSVCSEPSLIMSVYPLDVRYESVAAALHTTQTEVVYVVGLATDFCVNASVHDLLQRGFKVVVILNAVAGVDTLGALDALEGMDRAGARLMIGETTEVCEVDTPVPV